VLVEDKLFATLDPTSRRLELPGNTSVMLIDTVGFIHKLPHQLVDAFKSTLEEVRTADLLLHVVDVTHPHWAEQKMVVEQVLDELGVGQKPVLTVFNKLDRLTQGEVNGELLAPWQSFAPSHTAGDGERAVRISALTGEGIDALLAAVERYFEWERELVQIDLPLGAGGVLAWLRRSGKVVEEAYSETIVSVTALVSPKVAGQLRKRLAVGERLA